MSLRELLGRRFARLPAPLRAAVAAASGDPDGERVLAWGALAREGGWLAATSVGLRVVPAEGAAVEPEVLPWHEIGSARWQGTADGGGSFTVTALVEVEPGVQARSPARRYAVRERGDLPAVVRRRVDQTVVDSRRSGLPGGGSMLLVARRLPRQAAREWIVVFDDEADRLDSATRELARQRLAEVVALDQG